MYREFDGKYFFYDLKDGIEYVEPFVDIWCKSLKDEKSANTISLYSKTLHKFWIFCLYFPSKRNEDFYDYLIRYRDVIKNKGFTIKKKLII